MPIHATLPSAVRLVLSAVAVSALVGGLFGPTPARRPTRRFPNHYKRFTAALSAIESNYVDKVDSDRLIYGAMRGMLGTLDPHSSFFDPREYAQMRERQEGRYYGLGISISTIDNYITAVRACSKARPRTRQGIRRGDIIAKIEGEETKGWTTRAGAEQAARPEGHAVQIEIKRRGYDDPIPLDVTRDEVYMPTGPGVLHARRDDRLHPPQGLGREHRSRHPARAERAVGEGDEAAASTTSARIPAARSIRRSRSRTSSCRAAR